MPTRYGRSPWVDTFPRSRVRAYPRHRGHLDTGVAIIGGGMTGCATAYAFAAAGIKVALVESTQIGRGTSGASAGWMSPDPGVSFVEIERTHGLRAARLAYHAWRRAALDAMALIRRLEIRCQFGAATTLHVALTPEQAAALTRDQKTRRAAGLDAPMVRGAAVLADTGLPSVVGLRLRDSAIVDPYRATLGLADAAASRGAQIFENSAVRRVRFRPKHVDIELGTGTIKADRVVIATGLPTPLFKPLVRHVWLRQTFLVLTDRLPVKVRKALGHPSTVIRDCASPEHIVRWVGEDRLLITGADAEQVPPRLRDKTLVQRTGQLMYELSTLYPDISGIQAAYGWDAAYAKTMDGLPYIGPHRNFPRHLFAFADTSRSVTGAFLASRILLRAYMDEPDPADAPFGFARALVR
jgi:glycine/D-amino acid oxidase-like deaminating enzyme